MGGDVNRELSIDPIPRGRFEVALVGYLLDMCLPCNRAVACLAVACWYHSVLVSWCWSHDRSLFALIARLPDSISSGEVPAFSPNTGSQLVCWSLSIIILIIAALPAEHLSSPTSRRLSLA